MPLESTLSGIFAFRVHFGRTSGALRAYLGRTYCGCIFTLKCTLGAKHAYLCTRGAKSAYIKDEPRAPSCTYPAPKVHLRCALISEYVMGVLRVHFGHAPGALQAHDGCISTVTCTLGIRRTHLYPRGVESADRKDFETPNMHLPYNQNIPCRAPCNSARNAPFTPIKSVSTYVPSATSAHLTPAAALSAFMFELDVSFTSKSFLRVEGHASAQ